MSTNFIKKFLTEKSYFHSFSGPSWITPLRHRDSTNLEYPLLVVKSDQIGAALGRDYKNQGPVSQQVWHDKDPSLLKDRNHQAL